jgi:AraC family transcriptional regulator of adaptative response/methylated-DNA-[protein]-cysteine methyltransferase
MEKLSYKIMFEAFKNCDSIYDGKFYVAVKSTGIYCLPSCKARLPHEKNIVFKKTREEAIQAGFRGCLRCKSEFFPDVNPKWLKEIKQYLDDALDKKTDEKELVHIAKVDISTIRRYFKHQYRLTPKAYHRKKRLQYAKSLIHKGSNYISAAYETGFESVSGFRDAFYKEFSQTPGEINDNNRN